MKNKQIVIIGAGQLGSRHLQAISLLHFSTTIWVVDPMVSSLETAKARWKEVDYVSQHEIHYKSDVKELPSDLDVVIIATSSNVRRNIIEMLLQERTVRYMILEKVLFQEEEDYFSIQELLENKGVKAWVNCPRRQFEGYSQLRKEINFQAFQMSVTGSQWGLGCNSIHFIDLFSYLCQSSNISVVPFLNEKLYTSKRAGFVEFNGSLLVASDNASKLLITCFELGNHPLEITIELPEASISIKESLQAMEIRTSANNWQALHLSFPILRQSQLTNLVIEDLLTSGTCLLTPFEESVKLHIPLINIFLNHYNQVNKTPNNIVCPIT
jgi:predicted dehydrogenase